jgi:hypothetical protein
MSESPPPTLPPTTIKAGFLDKIVTIALAHILLTKAITAGMRRSAKYKKIAASIQEVGIIEPPAVVPHGKSGEQYILLDGHMRVDILKEQGVKEVRCLISTDDESFTYNRHVSRLSSIQEHKMILNALERGLSEEKLAKSLNVDITNIRRKRDLLNGICEDAANLLKDKMVSAGAFPILRRMKPIRQFEAASLMVDANLYTTAFARSLLIATPKDKLLDPEEGKKIKGWNEEKAMNLEAEREMLDREYRLLAETYDTSVFNLTLVQGWLTMLLKNDRVKRYLSQNHAEIFAQFQQIVGMRSIVPKEAT